MIPNKVSKAINGVLNNQVRTNFTSCFKKKNTNTCKGPSPVCVELKEEKSQKLKPGLGTGCDISCGYRRSNIKEQSCVPIHKCCPKKCQILDPCCPDQCGKITCPKEKEIPCCSEKRCCCPDEEAQKGECCKAKPCPVEKRCARENACNDPCCPRKPVCPDQTLSKEECDDFDKSEVLMVRECPPDVNEVSGSCCDDGDCKIKKHTKDCYNKECPRKRKCEKKKKPRGGKPCLELDPNWPPKRPNCHGYPERDPCTPCQQSCKKKEVFDDGLY